MLRCVVLPKHGLSLQDIKKQRILHPNTNLTAIELQHSTETIPFLLTAPVKQEIRLQTANCLKFMET